MNGFSGTFFENSLTKVHEFRFDNKSFSHYLFFIISILSPLFILITIVAAIRTKLSKKWLWIIGMLIGLTKTTINWTSGEIVFKLINIQLLGAGFSKQGLVAPWTLSFSLPIVAIIFWLKRYKDLKNRSITEKNDRLQQ